MTPLMALWRPAMPGRVAMVAAVVVLNALARVAAAASGELWYDSVNQASAIVLTVGALVPIFVAMLGANLLRGEHASWSWIMARPRSRAQLIGAMMALDLVTVLVCMGAGWVVLGALEPGWFSWSTVEWGGSVCAAYVVLYLVAAVGGTRTHSSIRAITGGLAAVSAAGACLYGFVSLIEGQPVPGVDPQWMYLMLRRGPTELAALGLVHPLVLWLLAAIVAGASIPSAVIVAFVRTARLVPGRVEWPGLLRPLVGLWAVFLGLLVAGVVAVWSIAPGQATRDDGVEVELEVVVADSDTEFSGAQLSYDTEFGEVGVRREKTRRVAYRGAPRTRSRRIELGRRVRRFLGLGAGDYRACGTFERAAPTASRPHGVAVYERCVDLELAPGEHRRVTIQVGKDVPARLVRHY